MKSLKLAVAISAALWVSGCATIVSDSDYKVSIQSTPSNAQFELLNDSGTVIHAGHTPDTVTLAAGNGFFQKASYTLNFKLEDQVMKSVPITASLDGWYIGNILLGGVVGMLIVDPITGAMYSLPDSVSTNLTVEYAEFEKGKPKIQVMNIDQLPEEYRDSLVAIAN